MSKDSSKFFYGPADVTLYDSTNGYSWLGYIEDVQVNGSPLMHNIFDGNRRKYGISYKFRTKLQQSDQSFFDDLETREATRQTIYICGLNNMVKLDNMYIFANPEIRDDNIHYIDLRAETEVKADFTKFQNLLLNSDMVDFTTGVADNFSTDGTGTSSNTSHVSGGGNEQRVTLDAQYYRQDIIMPFETARRITASAYVIDRGGLGVTCKIGFILLDNSGSTISTHEVDFTLGAGANGRQSNSVLVVPSSPVKTIRWQIREANAVAASLGIDNAMLNFGPLTTYANN